MRILVIKTDMDTMDTVLSYLVEKIESEVKDMAKGFLGSTDELVMILRLREKLYKASRPALNTTMLLTKEEAEFLLKELPDVEDLDEEWWAGARAALMKELESELQTETSAGEAG